MQFSFVPWLYDQEVIEHTKAMIALRESYANKIVDLARASTETGEPINTHAGGKGEAEEDVGGGGGKGKEKIAKTGWLNKCGKLVKLVRADDWAGANKFADELYEHDTMSFLRKSDSSGGGKRQRRWP